MAAVTDPGRPVRMIASDLDGTLLGADGQLSARTIGALRAAREVGIVVVAATGRAPTSSMPRLCSSLATAISPTRFETFVTAPSMPPR